MTVNNNPVRISIDHHQSGHFIMTLELILDAVGLRAQYRHLVVHLSNLPLPLIWDLSRSDMALQQRVECDSAPPRIVHTIYGVTPGNDIRLLFRNWGSPSDGLG